ncbi:MAG TPA: RDD family protein [Candidatus Thermoplasmatota archaeon]|nr:RDD family protein [Candidatus Thermoplasmatota archaeon]
MIPPQRAAFERVRPPLPLAPPQPPPAFSFQLLPPATAALGRRAAAYMLDFLLLGIAVVVLAIGAAVATLLQPGEVTPERLGAAMLPVLLLALPLFLGYFTVLEGLWGRTLGKAALGLRVRRLDGAPLTMYDSFVRNLLRLLWGPSLPSVALLLLGNLVLASLGRDLIVDVLALVALAFLLVDLWLVSSTEMEQRLGDLAAGTVVVDG